MKPQSNLKIMLRLSALVRPLAGRMALAVAMGTLGHLCAVMIPVLGCAALLDFTGAGSPIGWRAAFAGIVISAVLRGFLRYGEQLCNHEIAFRLLALIRSKVFAALRRLCPAKLEGRDKGNLISLITADIELLEVFYAHTISPVVIAVLFTAVMAVLFGKLVGWLALLALVGYGTVGMAVPMVANALSRGRGENFRRQSGALSAFLLESLRGLPEILQFGAGQARMAEMSARTQALSAEESRMKRQAAISAGITGALVTAFGAGMLFAGAALHSAGAVSFSELLLAAVLMMSSFGPAIALANLGTSLQNTFAAGRRVLEILDEAPVTEEVFGQETTEFAGAAANNVDFSYGEQLILQQVCADFPQGEIIGIHGKSGSGKSTLLRLLMCFWDTDGGEISISQKNIRRVNTADLRTMEGFVTQETQLFSGSIAENLRIAKPDATEEELRGACHAASLDAFLAGLEQGLETQVGELGERLSGGERQRLGLARAFLHGAPFLLLDEPTSNLDSLNEAAVLRSVLQARSGKTVVLVSHRKSTMRIADRVYSVDQGRMC